MTEFKFITLHKVVDNDNYCFEIEEFKRDDQQFLLAHIFFRKFSLKVLKHGLQTWRMFRRCVTAPIYAVRSDVEEHKWREFITLFGFVPTDIHLPCNNGNIRQLFISTVTPHGIKHTERLNVWHVQPVGTAGGTAN